MDLSFGRGRRGHAAEPVRLDYPRLIAILVALQAASRSAQVESALAAPAAGPASPVDRLVALLNRAPGYAAAARAPGGSFNPSVAGGSP